MQQEPWVRHGCLQVELGGSGGCVPEKRLVEFLSVNALRQFFPVMVSGSPKPFGTTEVWKIRCIRSWMYPVMRTPAGFAKIRERKTSWYSAISPCTSCSVTVTVNRGSKPDVSGLDGIEGISFTSINGVSQMHLPWGAATVDLAAKMCFVCPIRHVYPGAGLAAQDRVS